MTDDALFDEALRALLRADQGSPIEAGYASYDLQPLDVPDAWGDLQSFREATALRR